MKDAHPMSGEYPASVLAADNALAERLYDHRYGVGTFAQSGTMSEDKWRATAGEARRLMSPSMLAIIPIRQCFSVRVETADLRPLRALQEVMPKDVSPQALVWVHLEGVLSRDVG